jgi:hypothetical protein
LIFKLIDITLLILYFFSCSDDLMFIDISISFS